MIKIPNVHLKHNGIMADNSTKLTLYLPELTEDQHSELIKLAQVKTVGVVFVDPDQLDSISSVLKEASLIPMSSIDDIEMNDYASDDSL